MKIVSFGYPGQCLDIHLHHRLFSNIRYYITFVKKRILKSINITSFWFPSYNSTFRKLDPFPSSDEKLRSNFQVGSVKGLISVAGQYTVSPDPVRYVDLTAASTKMAAFRFPASHSVAEVYRTTRRKNSLDSRLNS